MARDHIHLLINGKPHTVRGAHALLSLSDYLRLNHQLIGTKIVCSEGDCGACTVLVADLDLPGAAAARYLPIDSCIAWMFQLDRTHIITVEGLPQNGSLHPVQHAMVNCHGSQCGFCTPGFVMAMAAMIEDSHASAPHSPGIDERTIRQGLTGNLCRCTGYVQIIDAAKSVDPRKITALAERYPLDKLRAQLDAQSPVHVIDPATRRECFIPSTVQQAADYLLANPSAKIVSGATDLGVAANKRLISLDNVLYVGRIQSLRDINISGGKLTMGAAATWSAVLAEVEDTLPQFAKILRVFGAPQIRNAATIGGNIINASPIADSLPLLFVTDAVLHLTSTTGGGGDRSVPINNFYTAYKKFDLRPGELLADVQLTLPTPNQHLMLYKVSKRHDLDISTFTAAILLTLDGPNITNARIAYGGVGPLVLRLPRTESFLANKPLTESLMRDAGAIAQKEISPITDVRASADYRSQLAQTILSKAYFDIAPAADLEVPV